MIPAALCYTFGVMVGDTRQGWTVLAAMTVIFVGLLAVCVVAEQNGAVFVKQGVDHTASALQSGGNMEGKEVRFGIATSALWAAATTSASNGSVNSMHDSFTPIGGPAPRWVLPRGVGASRGRGAPPPREPSFSRRSALRRGRVRRLFQSAPAPCPRPRRSSSAYWSVWCCWSVR